MDNTARMSIYLKQSSRLPRCCLSYFLEAARYCRSLPRLSALSVDSPYAEMEPRSRTERGRENRPGLWPILPNTVCRRLATLARVPMCRAARLCARLVPAHTPQPHKSQSSPRRVRGMHIWQVPQSLPAGAAPRRPAPRAVTTGNSAAGWPQRARNGGC